MKEPIVVFGEQGVGDQIRLLGPVADLALNHKSEVIYLCDERLTNHFKSEIQNLRLEPFANFNQYSDARYYDGFGILERYDSVDELATLLQPSVVLHRNFTSNSDPDHDEEKYNGDVGCVWWSSHWDGWARYQSGISPCLIDLAREYCEEKTQKLVSLQYPTKDSHRILSEKERCFLKYPDQKIDLLNDFGGIFDIAKSMKIVVGCHSAQIYIAALSGVPAEVYINQGNFLCLGDSDIDPLCNSIKFKRTKLHREIPNLSKHQVTVIEGE